MSTIYDEFHSSYREDPSEFLRPGSESIRTCSGENWDILPPLTVDADYRVGAGGGYLPRVA